MKLNNSNTCIHTGVDAGMDWNDVIESDGREFIILPEGDYAFTVSKFERGFFPGSAKLSPCNKATLILQVKTNEGVANARTDLLLNRRLEWRLASFFRSIGQKKRGEKVIMDWTHIVGSQGRAHFKPHTYTDKNGSLCKANNVERFIDYDEKFFAGKSAVKSDISDYYELLC